MKFNIYLPQWRKKCLEEEYKEYIKVTPMTEKEHIALREWVKNGNSVYENSDEAMTDAHTPIEFLIVYRDNEYIRQNTKRMTPEETRRFALAYYGWDDESDINDTSEHYETTSCTDKTILPNELPF